MKLSECGVVAIARDLALEELSEALDQVQVRRIGWQIQQLDAQGFGRISYRRRVIVRHIVEYDQQTLVTIGASDLLQYGCDPLGITRLPAFPAEQALVVGGIDPNEEGDQQGAAGRLFDLSAIFGNVMPQVEGLQ